MLTDRSIICFAHDYDGDPTSKTHIMRLLAPFNRVLWVNSIAMRRPTASGRDLRRLVSKVRRGLQGCREVGRNFFVASPLVLPLPGVAAADRINAGILAAWLRRLCRRHRLDRPLLWTFLPNVNRLVGRLGEQMVIYHCVDEYAEFAGVQKDALIAMEQDLVRRSHLVITSSERLRDERAELNPHTTFVPHGVDVAHFSRAADPETRIPPDLADLRRPVIGFFGLIAEWIDLDLIGSMARRRPDWSFLLIGRATVDVAPLQGLPNVRWIGPRPYADLPSYCRAIDVGIIPFRLNDLTLRANPLKLREYLAAGLPVVSTPLPEVRRYEGLVRLGEGRDGFLSAIDASLRDRSAAARRARIEAMMAEGWEARVEQISALIERRLPPAAA